MSWTSLLGGRDLASLSLIAPYQPCVFSLSCEGDTCSPCTGSEFSFALAPLGLPWLEDPTFFSSIGFSSSPSSTFFFGLSADLDANDSFVCWVGAAPALPKNLLQRRGTN